MQGIEFTQASLRLKAASQPFVRGSVRFLCLLALDLYPFLFFLGFGGSPSCASSVAGGRSVGGRCSGGGGPPAGGAVGGGGELEGGSFFFFRGEKPTRLTTRLHRAHKEFCGRNRTDDTPRPPKKKKKDGHHSACPPAHASAPACST